MALVEQRDRVAPGDGELVFPGADGGYLVYKQVHRALRQTAARAGVDKPVRLHVLRHTFASHCYMRGVPPQIVQKWLGHSSVVTTERYAHLRPDAGDELIDALDGCEVSAELGATTGATKRRVTTKKAA